MTNIIIRGGAIFLGVCAIIVQVQLLQEHFAGSSRALLAAVPIVSVALALSLGAVEWAWAKGKHAMALASLAGFMLLAAVSLSGTLGRVSENRATRAAAAAKTEELRVSATKARDDAQAAVNEAMAQVTDECRTAKGGAGKTCLMWQSELASRRTELNMARQNLAAVPQPMFADADMQRISDMTGLPIETVERWVPALFPIGLEVIVVLTFWIGLSRERDVELPELRFTPRAPEPEPMQVEEVQATPIAAFLSTEDWQDMSVGEMYRAFEKWGQSNGQPPMNVRRFGKLLDEAGLTKRRVNGRIIVSR